MSRRHDPASKGQVVRTPPGQRGRRPVSLVPHAEIESGPSEPLADYARIAELLMEHGPNLRLPHSRAFGGGLFELRPRGKSGIGRAFYCFLVGQRAVVLHAFIKKSRQTPDRELKLARKRMKEVSHG